MEHPPPCRPSPAALAHPFLDAAVYVAAALVGFTAGYFGLQLVQALWL